jgi:hypothetical protein
MAGPVAVEGPDIIGETVAAGLRLSPVRRSGNVGPSDMLDLISLG